MKVHNFIRTTNTPTSKITYLTIIMVMKIVDDWQVYRKKKDVLNFIAR